MSASDGPAAAGIPSGWFPTALTPVDHVEPVPRRIRALIGSRTILDTRRALYVWEHPYYPQFYIPAADVDAACLHDDGERSESAAGSAQLRSLVVGDERRGGAAWFYDRPRQQAVKDHYRFAWGALDAWYEEDEQVFVHPRSPFVRVDALRTTGHLHISKDELTLAEATAWVTVVETGLPPRFYLDASSIDTTRLEPSATRSECPYKGRTTGYWSVRTPTGLHTDLAWSYDFPTRQLTSIAGLIAFLGEQVTILRDGVPLP